MSKKFVGAAVASLIIAGVAVYWLVLPGQKSDPLCAIVQEKGFRCTTILASSTLFAPGAVIRDYKDDVPPPKVHTPNSLLFSGTCLLPGADIDKKPSWQQPFDVSLGTIEYSRKVAVGATGQLELPKLADSKLEIGGDFSAVSTAKLSSKRSTIYLLDENEFLGHVQNCAIAPVCIERILRNNDKIISSILVTDGLNYEFLDSQNKKLAFKTELIDGGAKFTLGPKGAAGGEFKESQIIPGSAVLGVKFLGSDELKRVQPCSAKSLLGSVTGSGRVNIAGGGKRGAIPPAQADVVLGKGEASVAALGGESSECRAGEETRSGAEARANIVPGSGQVTITGRVHAGGGHFRTVASCFLGKAVGFTGHDTTATASLNITAATRLLVRSSEVNEVLLKWSGFPSGSSVVLRDAFGRELATASEANGERRVKIDNLGVFTAEARIAINLNGTGAAGRPTVQFRAVLSLADLR